MRKILKTKVYHDGKSMIVLNVDDSHDVPERFVQSWIDEGVIAGKTSKQVAHERQAKVEDDEAQVNSDGDNPFTAKHKGFGVYEITGPGLDAPEEVKGGKDQASARLAELWTASAAGDGDAPVA